MVSDVFYREALTPGDTSFKVAAKTTSYDVIRVYTGLIIEHILLGIDHLLFVFALLLILKGWRRIGTADVCCRRSHCRLGAVETCPP